MQKFEQSSVFKPRDLSGEDINPRKVPVRTPIEECHTLFINPTVNPDTQNPVLNAVMRSMFPMSMGYVAGYIEHVGLSKVYFVDQMVDEMDDAMLESLINAMPKPRVIGISVLTATCGPAYYVGRLAKKIDPECIVVMGGVHATVCPDEPIREKAADITVRGEGEETFAELMECILAGKPYHQVAGITCLNPDGEMVNTESRALPKNLDDFPPFPYHLFAHNAETYGIGFYSIQTSRGCPYKCTFCSQRSMTALSYRYVSTERALEDIETLVYDYGAKVIHLIDDNIAVNKKRLHRLLDEVIARGLHEKVTFEGAMRADNMDDDIYEKLQAANFDLVTFGLETGSERLMAQMQKGETVECVVDAIEESKRRGFTVGTTIIFGFPTETWKERWDAIKMVFSMPADSVRFNILTPYPGTAVYHEILDSGDEVKINKDWSNFSVQYMWEGSDLPYVAPDTNKWALMFITMFANLAYYLRPKGIWKMMTSSVAGGNVIILPERWFLSGYLFKISRVALYLIGRFLQVFVMMCLTVPIDWIKRLIFGRSAPEPVHQAPAE